MSISLTGQPLPQDLAGDETLRPAFAFHDERASGVDVTCDAAPRLAFFLPAHRRVLQPRASELTPRLQNPLTIATAQLIDRVTYFRQHFAHDGRAAHRTAELSLDRRRAVAHLRRIREREQIETDANHHSVDTRART